MTILYSYRLVFALLLPTLWVVATPAFAQCTNSAIPGRSYEYYIVAQTGSCNGNNFTSLGSNPAINDFAQVGFMAQTSALPGNAIFVGDGHNNPATTPINPGEIGSSEIYDGAVQIGSAYPGAASLVSKDSITTTSSATTSIRVWNVDTPDSYRYAARGGPSQQFGAVFPYPSVNKNGDVAFTALDQNNPTIKYLVEVLADGTLYKKPVTVSVGEPMIDDNDDVLLYSTATNSHGNFELVLYGRGLSGPTTIADGYTFSSIGSAPGISRDGNVIAFQATMLSILAFPGPTAAPASTWRSKPARDGNFIRLPAFRCMAKLFANCHPPRASRGPSWVSTHPATPFISTPAATAWGRAWRCKTGLGATVLTRTFVNSFIGTPTEASRPNPVLNNGTPLFFSGQQGLWTIRVDMEAELGAGYQTMYSPHARTAIPVVQIGDRIGANTDGVYRRL